MESVHKPGIVRLARIAGVKSVSDGSVETVRNIVTNHLSELIKVVCIANGESGTKTVMKDDLYAAFNLMGINMARSESLGTSTTPCNPFKRTRKTSSNNDSAVPDSSDDGSH